MTHSRSPTKSNSQEHDKKTSSKSTPLAKSKTPSRQASRRDDLLETDSTDVVTLECTTCHESVDSRKFANIKRYELKPGENLFDFEGSTASTQTLTSFVNLISASNVYRMFFAYTQILQHDGHRCSSSYHKHGHLNRFNDIPCIEETRVHVKHPSDDHDYIHANWVDGYREPKKFILTQAPLPQTVDQFWAMVWQEKCLVVVSMIQTVDVHGAEWCPSYIPEAGKSFISAGFKLHNCGTRRIRNAYDATVIKIEFQGKERKLLHCCFFSWGYRGTPIRPTELLNFISDINYNRELLIKEAIGAKWMNTNDISPITIYCLTGTGRSATVIALDICFRKLDDTAKRTCGPLLDVQDVVLRLRTRRAMAIQDEMDKGRRESILFEVRHAFFFYGMSWRDMNKAEQYLFLHLAALEYAVRQRYLAEKSYSEADLDNYFYQTASSSKEVAEKGNKSKPLTPKN